MKQQIDADTDLFGMTGDLPLFAVASYVEPVAEPECCLTCELWGGALWSGCTGALQNLVYARIHNPELHRCIDYKRRTTQEDSTAEESKQPAGLRYIN